TARYVLFSDFTSFCSCFSERSCFQFISSNGNKTCVRHIADTNGFLKQEKGTVDRKSTRLNSSHVSISYAVFCLKKKSIDGHRSDVEAVATATKVYCAAAG